MNKNEFKKSARERESERKKPKLIQDKYYYNSQKKITIIIHMKHYHIKHFYFLIKSTVPV